MPEQRETPRIEIESSSLVNVPIAIAKHRSFNERTDYFTKRNATRAFGTRTGLPVHRFSAFSESDHRCSRSASSWNSSSEFSRTRLAVSRSAFSTARRSSFARLARTNTRYVRGPAARPVTRIPDTEIAYLRVRAHTHGLKTNE